MPFATAISFGLLRLIIATQESGWDWLPHSSLTSTKTIIPCYLLVPCNPSLSLTVILYMQLEFFFNIDARTWLSLEAFYGACVRDAGVEPSQLLAELATGLCSWSFKSNRCIEKQKQLKQLANTYMMISQFSRRATKDE
jgi:hypothetical protein